MTAALTARAILSFMLTAASPAFAHTETWRDASGVTHTDTVDGTDATAMDLDNIVRQALGKPHTQLAEDKLIHGLVTKEIQLDEHCRGDINGNNDACIDRQKIIYILDKMGWCWGKEWQSGAESEWHRCEADSNHTTVEDLHSYDTLPNKEVE